MSNKYFYQGSGKPTSHQKWRYRLLKMAKAGCEESAATLMKYWGVRVVPEKELIHEQEGELL